MRASRIKDYFSWNLSIWSKALMLQHHKLAKSSKEQAFLFHLQSSINHWLCICSNKAQSARTVQYTEVMYELHTRCTVPYYTHACTHKYKCTCMHIYRHRAVPTKTGLHQETSVRFTALLYVICNQWEWGVAGGSAGYSVFSTSETEKWNPQWTLDK